MSEPILCECCGTLLQSLGQEGYFLQCPTCRQYNRRKESYKASTYHGEKTMPQSLARVCDTCKRSVPPMETIYYRGGRYFCKECLAKIELPKDTKIPDYIEVEDRMEQQWIVPLKSVTAVKISAGTRVDIFMKGRIMFTLMDRWIDQFLIAYRRWADR